MRRLLKVAAAIFLPTVLVALLALSTPQTGQPGLPDQVTLLVDAYLKYHLQPTQTIRQIISARQPWNFTRQMSGSAVGGSEYVLNGPSPATPLPGAQPVVMSTLVASWRFGSTDNKPVPFPPVALWCVLLRSTDDASPHLVYVAQHIGDFSMVWLIHEPAIDLAQDLSAGLASVGCNAGQTP